MNKRERMTVMIVLGEQYYLIDSFYSNDESYMQLQLNDMIIEFRKRC